MVWCLRLTASPESEGAYELLSMVSEVLLTLRILSILNWFISSLFLLPLGIPKAVFLALVSVYSGMYCHKPLGHLHLYC